jgi:hypothetical protein
MEELKVKELQNQNSLIKETVEELFEETDMMQYEVEQIAKNKRLVGKTMAEWETFFRIPVSRQADPMAVSEYCSMIIERLDTAYANKNKLEAQMMAFKMAYLSGHNEEVLREAAHKGRKVVPKLETMEAVAAAKMGTWTLTVTRYEKAIAFFQSMIYKLNTTLDAVKTIAMSNGTLRKAEMGAY